ncbi:MAG: nuclease [Selenomonadaceae bacterium]|nr:nuclease [Selenomonadaceae bacterium]
MIIRKRLILAILTVFLILSVVMPVLASTYIGNKSSHRFHYSNCPSVAEMHPYNKVAINSREEAISEGYVPCKRCKP